MHPYLPKLYITIYRSCTLLFTNFGTLLFTDYIYFLVFFLSVTYIPLVYLSYNSNKNSIRLVSFIKGSIGSRGRRLCLMYILFLNPALELLLSSRCVAHLYFCVCFSFAAIGFLAQQPLKHVFAGEEHLQRRKKLYSCM